MSLIIFNSLSEFANLKHFVATKQFGNVSFSASDNPSEVLRNREKIAKELGVTLDDFVVAGLVHGNGVAVVDRSMKGRGSRGKDDVINAADAMVTNEKGILLMIPVADCVPVIFYDPANKAIGIAHAGWRGTLKGIAASVVAKMQDAYGTKPRDLVCGIGPCICVRHYEVDEAVLTGAKGHFDLRAANSIQLIQNGVRNENIEAMDYCTYERTDLFFSHRAEGKTGRFATGIMIM